MKNYKCLIEPIKKIYEEKILAADWSGKEQTRD